MSTPHINSAMNNRGVAAESAPAVSLPKGKAATVEHRSVAPKGSPSADQLQNMVEKANKAMDKTSSSLEFSVDNTTNKTVVKVMEANSGKLIMQFPSEEMLSITRAIDMAQKGALLKDKA